MNTMITVVLGVVLAALFVAGGVSARRSAQDAGTAAADRSGQRYNNENMEEAGIGLRAARSIAEKACSGVIVSGELERERGGSGLRYSFDIRRDGVIREVGVDAVTGKVLENSVEGPGSD